MERNSKLNRTLFVTEPVSPEQVHIDIWKSRAEKSSQEALNKYSFYTARTLMVKCPEIYLRADRRFYNHIASVPGYKNAYLEGDRESKEFLPHAQYFRSAPFSFDLVNMAELKTTTSCRSLYPARYPFMPYADRRMLPLASTLKTTDKLITELEMASMRYIMAVEETKLAESVFVIYSEEGMAWVADNEKIICAASGKEVSEIPGKVVLIFNENYVWYPLMERDDTSDSTYLARLVAMVEDNAGIPELTVAEEELCAMLKGVTALTAKRQKAMAEIAAVRSTGRYTKWFKFHDLWDVAMPAQKERAWQYYGYLEQLMIRANSLSPIAAYIAACSRNVEGYNKLLVVDREWVDLAALPNHNYVWGHLWDECLVEYIMDESFRINSGHCMAQACIISSILDLAGIDNYLLEGEVPSSHHFVFVPVYEFTFDNGKLQSSQNTIHWNGPRGNKVLARFHYQGKFASPVAGGHYAGTFSPEESVKVLSGLQSLYNDSVIIYKDGANEINKKRIDMEKIPTTKNYKILKNEEWENLQIP